MEKNNGDMDCPRFAGEGHNNPYLYLPLLGVQNLDIVQPPMSII